MLAPLATSRKTTHRFNLSRSDSAYGRGELSLGAPRIHGELLKLGITISERTVSRYLRGRPTTRSQTWRTFFANHFEGQTFISPLIFADADDENIVVDASDGSLCPVPPIDAACACIHGRPIDRARSRQLSSLGVSLVQHHLQDRTETFQSSGRDPRRRLLPLPASRHLRRLSFVRGDGICATEGSVRLTCPSVVGHLQL